MTRFCHLALAFLLACAAGGASAVGVAIFTRPAGGRYDGAWTVEVAARGEVESRVFDADGALVAGPFANKEFVVPDVTPWTAETPVCYRLETVTSEGERTETLFGFCEKVIRGRRLFVNGRPVRLRLAPKAQHGNTMAAIDGTPEQAWTNGLYRLPSAWLARLEVQRPLGTAGATRHAFQDWSVKPTNRCERIVVANRNAFRDASDITLVWTLLVDGEADDDGTIDLLRLKPGQEASFDLPEEVVAARFRPGTVSVRFAFVRDGETEAEDQIDLAASRELNAFASAEGWLAAVTPDFLKPRVAYDEDVDAQGGRVRRLTTDAAQLIFAEDQVGAVSYVRRGWFSPRRLVGAVLPCREGPSAGFLEDLALPPSPVESRRGALTFTSMSEGEDLRCAVRWTVYPDGTAACQAKLCAMQGRADERLGLALSLGTEPDAEVTWFGRGPWSTYPGCTEGAFLGLWRTNAVETLVAEEVRGVRVGDLTVRTLGAPMAVRLTGTGGSLLELFGDPSGDGTVDLAFTLSAGDRALTARAPDGAADLPLFPTSDKTSNKEREAR